MTDASETLTGTIPSVKMQYPADFMPKKKHQMHIKNDSGVSTGTGSQRCFAPQPHRPTRSIKSNADVKQPTLVKGMLA